MKVNMVPGNEPLPGNLAGKRIWVHALGCRTNQYEAEALASMLSIRGAVITKDLTRIDAAVLLSCTVTSSADRKCRQLSRRVKRLFPHSVLVVCGCWAQRMEESVSGSLGIDILVGSRDKSLIPNMLDNFFGSGHLVDPLPRKEGVMKDARWDPLFLEKPLLHTRAFLKVQDGCNHFCSYCIIPYVRGCPVSRDPDDLLREVDHVVSSGCHEVVLTGVHLGLYEKYGSISLGDLVRRVSEIEGLWRIRFGSLEPFAVNDELLEALSGSSRFCRHLHLPLQSGDDRVLEMMKRGYTGEEYLEILGKVRKFLGEDVHISTDVLVGFPGEDEKAFSNTLDLLKKARLGRLHVFPFSPRRGTPAYDMENRIPSYVVDERVHEAIALGEKSLEEYSERWVGKPVDVLVEKKEGARFEGLTPEFLKVESYGDHEVNQMVRIVPAGSTSGTLFTDLPDGFADHPGGNE